MRVRAPRAVADLLVSALPALRDPLLEQRIARAWVGLVGPDVARRARPGSFFDGCLQITVDNSPWLHELTLRAPELRERLRAEFGEVRSVRVVLDTLPPDPPPVRRSGEARAVPLSAGEVREIEAATSAIPDPTLAAAARRLMTKAWRSPGARGGSR